MHQHSPYLCCLSYAVVCFLFRLCAFNISSFANLLVYVAVFPSGVPSTIVLSPGLFLLLLCVLLSSSLFLLYRVFSYVYCLSSSICIIPSPVFLYLQLCLICAHVSVFFYRSSFPKHNFPGVPSNMSLINLYVLFLFDNIIHFPKCQPPFFLQWFPAFVMSSMLLLCLRSACFIPS